MGLFVAGSVPCGEHLSPSLTLKGSRTMIFEELCASTPHDPQSTTTYLCFGIFRKSKLNRTQLNRTKLKVKTDAKDDHGKTRGDMNVTPRTDASKFKSGGTFALIVLKSCGHFKVGEKYHNLAWVENKHV